MKAFLIERSKVIKHFIEQVTTPFSIIFKRYSKGLEAVQELDEEKPDIIFVSQVLDDISGYEAVRLIRQRIEFYTTPIIMISSIDTQEDIEKAFQAGINFYLTKSSLTHDRLRELLEHIANIEEQHVEKHKILAADDSKTFNTFTERLLEANGYEIKIAQNGKAALNLLEEYYPDLIITDYEMPIMNGIQLSKAVRNNPLTYEIPILMVSANDSLELIHKGFESGISDYLLKPVKASKFLLIIEDILSRRRDLKKNIMVIDDSSTHLHIYKFALEQEGFNVITEKSPLTGLKLAEEYEVDLFVVDIILPEIDGYTFATKIKEYEKYKDTPIIFVTSSEDTFSRLKSYSYSNYDYIIKPFRNKEFVLRVKTALFKSEEDRFEAKDKQLQFLKQLIGSVEHNINNPMAAVNMALSMIKQAGPLNEKQIGYVQRALESLDIISEKIQKLSNLKNIKLEDYPGDEKIIKI